MASLINPIHQYPSLKRTEVNGVRHYVGTSLVVVPSVTTILSATSDKTHLLAWRKRVGDAEANRISTESAGLGTIVHNSIEKYMLGKEYEVQGTNAARAMARDMVASLAKNGLCHINEVWGLECGLIAEGLYAGTADCVGIYKGAPCIIDFKTSKQIKKKEWITDYFLQCSAYRLAYNEMFGTQINRAVILMIDRNANFQDFVIEDDELDEYSWQWAQRLADYNGMLKQCPNR